MKKIISLLMLCALIITFVSCEDGSLAEKLDGTWNSTLTINGPDGMPVSMKEVTIFRKTIDDGGEFVSSIKSSEKTLADDGTPLTINYTTKVKGTWSVCVGDLVLNYTLGTLNVNISDESLQKMAKHFIDNDDEMIFESQDEYQQAIVEIAESMRNQTNQSLHQELYKFYDELNKTSIENNCTYVDLKIDGNTMTCRSSDAGIMTYTRMK